MTVNSSTERYSLETRATLGEPVYRGPYFIKEAQKWKSDETF